MKKVDTVGIQSMTRVPKAKCQYDGCQHEFEVQVKVNKVTLHGHLALMKADGSIKTDIGKFYATLRLNHSLEEDYIKESEARRILKKKVLRNKAEWSDAWPQAAEAFNKKHPEPLSPGNCPHCAEELRDPMLAGLLPLLKKQNLKIVTFRIR